MQVPDFQILAFFFFLFAPHLHHEIESFKPKSRHFHILSIKTALFVDSSSFLQTPSIKTAVFMDSNLIPFISTLLAGSCCNHTSISRTDELRDSLMVEYMTYAGLFYDSSFLNWNSVTASRMVLLHIKI